MHDPVLRNTRGGVVSALDHCIAFHIVGADDLHDQIGTEPEGILIARVVDLEEQYYSLSHMTLHFFAVSSWSLGLYSSGSSMSSCQYRSSSLRISAIAARHVSDVTFSNPSSRWTRSPAMV